MKIITESRKTSVNVLNSASFMVAIRLAVKKLNHKIFNIFVILPIVLW